MKWRNLLLRSFEEVSSPGEEETDAVGFVSGGLGATSVLYVFHVSTVAVGDMGDMALSTTVL